MVALFYSQNSANYLLVIFNKIKLYNNSIQFSHYHHNKSIFHDFRTKGLLGKKNVNIILSKKENMTPIQCACGGEYLFNITEFDDHLKDEQHINWIKTIVINCLCGQSYDYYTQNNHFRSVTHRSWRSKDPIRYNKVVYICLCGTTFPFYIKDHHLSYHPQH